jgi:TolA-binding protein
MKMIKYLALKTCLIGLIVTLSSCSSITTLRTKEIRAVGDEVSALRKDVEVLQVKLDSMSQAQERLQNRLKADMMSVIGRVTEEAEKTAGLLAENQYRLDLLIGQSDKILSKKVVVETRLNSSGDTLSGESVKTLFDLDMEKLYNNAKSDYYRNEFKLAYDGFKQVYEKVQTGSLAENALYWMGVCLEEAMQPDKSAVVYAQLLSVFPESRKGCVVRLRLANMAEQNKNSEERVRYLQEIVAAPQCMGTNESMKAADLLKQSGRP